MEKKIVLKIIIIAIELIVSGILITNIEPQETVYNYDEEDFEKKIFHDNSYYTDATILVSDIHRQHTIENFMSFIIEKKYDNAFEMITDQNKVEMFDNNIQNFKTYFDTKLKSKNINNYYYELLSEFYEANIGFAKYYLNIDGEEFEFTIEDYGPYTQQIVWNK